MIRNRGKVRKR